MNTNHGSWVATAALLGGYFLIWSGFGVVAFAGDILVHQLVHHWSWLASHPWMIAGTTLLVAAGFQFTPIKARHVDRCRVARSTFLQQYRPGRDAAWSLGLAHGVDCLGHCWALMLLMFGLGMGNVLWMASLAGVMFLEKTPRLGKLLVPIVGAVLLASGGLAIVSPDLLSPVLGDPA